MVRAEVAVVAEVTVMVVFVYEKYYIISSCVMRRVSSRDGVYHTLLNSFGVSHFLRCVVGNFSEYSSEVCVGL